MASLSSSILMLQPSSDGNDSASSHANVTISSSSVSSLYAAASNPNGVAAAQRFSFAFNDERFSDRILALIHVPSQNIGHMPGGGGHSSSSCGIGAAAVTSWQSQAHTFSPSTLSSEQKSELYHTVPSQQSFLSGRLGAASSLAATLLASKRITSLDDSDTNMDAGEDSFPSSANTSVPPSVVTPSVVTSVILPASFALTNHNNNNKSLTAAAGDEGSHRGANSGASHNVVLRRLHISSILLARDSRFFKAMLTNGMMESQSKEIQLEVKDENEADLVVALLRFLYTGELTVSDGSPITSSLALPLLFLADKFGTDSAVVECSAVLCRDLSLEKCCQYLDLPDSLTLNDSCRELMAKSRAYIALQFKDLDNKWDTDTFLNLNCKAACAVLASDEIEVRNENTIYHAARRWWMKSRHSVGSHLAAHTSPSSSSTAPTPSTCVAAGQSSLSSHVVPPASISPLPSMSLSCVPSGTTGGVVEITSASLSPYSTPASLVMNVSASLVTTTVLSLLHTIRFPQLGVDFVLDVVKYDTSWYIGPPATHRPIRKALQNASREATEFYACSAKRRQVHPAACKLMFQGRASCVRAIGIGPPPFTWRLERVSKMVEGRYIFSPSFYLDGYWFRLQAGRIRWERADGYAFSLFLSMDLAMSGVTCERGFFVQTESQLLVRNIKTQQYEPTHLPSFDTFTCGICELGYFDVFKKSWAELVHPTSLFVDRSDDSLCLSVRVKLLP